MESKIKEILSKPLAFQEVEICRSLLDLIDLTSLEGSDTQTKVEDLCQKALQYETAAVCVYPSLVGVAKKVLKDSQIKIACVAGAFPSSQTPLFIKEQEVKYAIEQGADEIDMVMSLRLFFQNDFQGVAEEIKALKNICGPEVHLKVILETGSLSSPENIRKASEIAIASGADFIKTSTGKTSVSATLEAFYIMLEVIEEHYKKTAKKIGIKPAGGISDIQVATQYYSMVYHKLGEEWMTPDLFRIGASRLAEALIAKINKEERV